MPCSEEDRLAVRTRPPGRPVLLQKWLNLTFVHWEVEIAKVRSLLPSGLEVDTFEGKTYVGLVPFTMRDIRPPWCPAVPGLSHFHETNVRLYVIGPNGLPGVWFLSLDAANRVGVWLGRKGFGLNYKFARMSVTGKPFPSYRSHRPNARLILESEPVGAEFEARPGSLEYFLTERYALFTQNRGGLQCGRVWHKPYLLMQAKLRRIECDLVQDAGVATIGQPASVLWSPGVEAEIFPLASV